MNKIRVGEIWDDKFESIIRDLVAKSSMFKTKIYKSLLMNETVSSINIKEYISYVNGFIDLWAAFADELTDKIKSTKAVVPKEERHRVVDIDDIKNYIYSAYDYASILQLADGILEGVSSKKFTSADDVKDFKDTVAEKALNTSGSDIADVLDEALNRRIFSDNLVVCDAGAVARYNALARYKIFNPKDSNVLFKSIDKTIQFITSGNNIEKYVSRLDMKLFISVLNGILDYITLSLAVYASRAYIIDRYARSFYSYVRRDEEVKAARITEAADNTKESFLNYYKKNCIRKEKASKDITVFIMKEEDKKDDSKEVSWKDLFEKDKIKDNINKAVEKEGISLKSAKGISYYVADYAKGDAVFFITFSLNNKYYECEIKNALTASESTVKSWQASDVKYDTITEATESNDKDEKLSNDFSLFGVKFTLPSIGDKYHGEKSYHEKKDAPTAEIKDQAHQKMLKMINDPKKLKKIEDDILADEKSSDDGSKEDIIKKIKSYLSKSKIKDYKCTKKGNSIFEIDIPKGSSSAWLEHGMYITSDGKVSSYDEIEFYESASNEGEDVPERKDTPDVNKASSATELNNVETRVIIDADDTICRDISKAKEFFDLFLEFLQNIGAMYDNAINMSFNDCYYYTNANDDNLFGKRLVSNPITIFMKKDNFGYIAGPNTFARINEINQLLKDFTYNPHQGLQGSFSPKNEIMHVIRGTEPEKETVEGYHKLALDLYKYSMMVLRSLHVAYNNIAEWKSKERVEGDYNLATTNLISECAKIISEIYRDLSMTVLQKARDIETQINRLRNVEIDKTLSSLKLDIFTPKSEDITDANMTTVVPNTTPMPVDLMDLYSLPAFESYQMYDEYLRTLPEFVNDTYLSEDLDMSAMMNNIAAALSGFLNKFARFFQNKSVQAAFNYVSKNKNELLSLTFDGVNGLEVLPYKENIDLSGAKDFSTNLNNFNADKDLANDEAEKKFIISLYPSEEIYNLFNGEKADKKAAATAYRNTIMFGQATDIKNKELKNNEAIKAELKNWIGTLEQGTTIFNEVKKMIDDMSQVVKNFKVKVANVSAQAAKDAKADTNNNTQNPPAMSGGNDNNTNNNGNTSTQNTNEQNSANATPTDRTQLVNKLIADIQKAQINTIIPLQGIIIQIIKDEYRYIQEAYQIGKKPGAAGQQAQSQQQTPQNT